MINFSNFPFWNHIDSHHHENQQHLTKSPVSSSVPTSLHISWQWILNTFSTCREQAVLTQIQSWVNWALLCLRMSMRRSGPCLPAAGLCPKYSDQLHLSPKRGAKSCGRETRETNHTPYYLQIGTKVSQETALKIPIIHLASDRHLPLLRAEPSSQRASSAETFPHKGECLCKLTI